MDRNIHLLGILSSVCFLNLDTVVHLNRVGDEYMTFALARRFGERIVIVADTMITEDPRRKSGNDIIPGALKALVVNGKLSIAFSGSEIIALDAIRALKQELNIELNLKNVITYLKDIVSKRFKSETQCEFIVASHLSGPQLLKIWGDGQASEAGDNGQLWIGNSEPVDAINELERAKQLNSPIEWISNDEMRLLNASAELGLDPVRFRQLGVGGFLIPLLASPIGHTYQGFASATFWDVVAGGHPIPAAQLEARSSGMTFYQYQIMANFYRGASVAGVHLEQAKVGFLYRPMVEDRGHTIRNVSAEEMSKIVSDACREAGGWVDN